RWRGEAVLCAVLLLGYWALLTLVPVPGGAAGVVVPGHDLGPGLDRALFRPQLLGALSRTCDPRGLLATPPAAGTGLLGVRVGRWLRSDRTPLEKTVGLFVAGNAGLFLGLVWNAVFPINKPLWTSSYVVFTGGMACHVLALCYWLIDVRGRRLWAMPFIVYGMNAIAAFFLSSLFARILNLVRRSEE